MKKIIQDIYNSALSFYENENFESCIEILEWGLWNWGYWHESYWELLRLKAHASYELGNFAIAKEFYTKSIDARRCTKKFNSLSQRKEYYYRPDDEELFFLRGLCSMKESNEKEAFDDFKKALKINPNYLEKYLKDFIKKEKDNNYHDALKFIKELIISEKYKEISFSHRFYKGSLLRSGMSLLKEFFTDLLTIESLIRKNPINQYEKMFEMSCLEHFPIKFFYFYEFENERNKDTYIEIRNTAIKHFLK